jgi:hypothetical protein
MPTYILIALGVGILVILLFTFFLIRGNRRIKVMQETVLAHAIPAQATVMNLARGDFVKGGAFRQIELRLTLHVEHPHHPAYETKTEWLVDEIALPQVQPQQVVKVKVNRDHPERVYPNVEWAEFSDWKIKRQ